MIKSIITAILALLFVFPAPFCHADEEKDHICFRSLDADRDGVVTPQEFEAHYGKSQEKFEAADANKDGKLTHDEYHSSLGHGSS